MVNPELAAIIERIALCEARITNVERAMLRLCSAIETLANVAERLARLDGEPPAAPPASPTVN